MIIAVREVVKYVLIIVPVKSHRQSQLILKAAYKTRNRRLANTSLNEFLVPPQPYIVAVDINVTNENMAYWHSSLRYTFIRQFKLA